MKKPEWFTFEFIIYIAKCLVGLVLCYFFYIAFPKYRFYWSIVSVLLVISPDDLDCKRLPIARMKANIIGSLVGLFVFLIHPTNLLIMALGTVLTIVICYMISLGAATRSALAALIIVLVQEASDCSLISAFERMTSVVLGCLVALFVTFIFQYALDLYHKPKNTTK